MEPVPEVIGAAHGVEPVMVVWAGEAWAMVDTQAWVDQVDQLSDHQSIILKVLTFQINSIKLLIRIMNLLDILSLMRIRKNHKKKVKINNQTE